MPNNISILSVVLALIFTTNAAGQQPVMRSEALSEDQRDRAAGMPTRSELDYRNLTEARLECRTKGSHNFLGSVKCEDSNGVPGLKSLIKKRFKDSTKMFAKSYYDGKIYTDLTAEDGAPRRVETPICNLLAGEGEEPRNANYKGDSCLDYAHLNVDVDIDFHLFDAPDVNVNITVDTRGKRIREYAWWRGLYLQLYYHFAGRVFREFEEGGKVTLTRLSDGTVPAGPLARDALRLQMGRQKVIQEIANIKGNSQEEVGYRKIAETRCEARDDKMTSHACRLAMTNEHEVAQWTYLMTAETNIRVQVEIDRQFKNMETLLARVTEKIEPICKNSPYNADCILCGDGERSDRVNRCYREQMPRILKEEIARYSTDALLPIPYDELRRDSQSQANSVPFQNGDSFTALAFLGLAFRRRFAARRRRTNDLVLVVLMIAAASFGCASADPCSGVNPPDHCGGGDVACAENSPTFDPMACGGNSGTGIPEGAGNFNEGRQGLADIRNEYMGSEYNLQPNPENNKKLAATAQGVDDVRQASSGYGGTGSSTRSAGGLGSVPKYAGTGSGASFGSVGSADSLSPSTGSRKVASEEEERTITSKNAGYGDVVGGGAAKESGSIFGSLFGSKQKGGEGGVGAVGYGVGDAAGAIDLDAYLKLVGNKSLFEIVSRRYDRWSTELEIGRTPANYEPGRGAAY